MGARPRFTLWKPRVFRLAPLRPGTALCARMKDADREHKDNVPNALLDGVAAGGQCQTQTISARAGRGGLCLVSMPIARLASSVPSTAADCSPEPIPDRGAELNLFIACTPSRAWRTAAEHKRISRALSALHHLRCRHAATALSCVAANMLHCFTPLPPVLNIEERPASQGLSARRISHWRSPHNHCLL